MPGGSKDKKGNDAETKKPAPSSSSGKQQGQKTSHSQSGSTDKYRVEDMAKIREQMKKKK